MVTFGELLIFDNFALLFGFLATIIKWCFFLLQCLQEPVELLEYSMNAATEGIDALATTRVVIRGENLHTTHALTGEPQIRSFRYNTRMSLL